MSPDQRLAAAQCFWEEMDAPDGLNEQHFEAIHAIARRLKFRPKSVQSLPIERRAKQLAMLPDISDAIVTRALIAYHLARQRPMMSAFLEALGIEHENGLIKDDQVPPPAADRLTQATGAIAGAFAAEDVRLYLNTLLTQDPDTWHGLEGFPALG